MCVTTISRVLTQQYYVETLDIGMHHLICILKYLIYLNYQNRIISLLTNVNNVNKLFFYLIQLFCRSASAIMYKNSWFGPGIGSSHLLEPKCTGTESTIMFCPFGNAWGRKNCSHSQDIGVKCSMVPIGKSLHALHLKFTQNKNKWDIMMSGPASLALLL